MDSLLIYGSVQSNPLYNCTGKTPEQWTSLLGTRRLFLGIALIIFGVFIEIIYVPCLGAIYKRGLLKHSCYKIMFLLGLTDMIATCTATILSGCLFTVGAVFCTYPELIYVAGCFALGGWVCSCALTLLLVINRISDILAPTISELIFSNNRTWIVAMIPIFYTLSVIAFTPAIIFNSTIMAWIGDPMIYENRSKEYYNPIQTTTSYSSPEPFSSILPTVSLWLRNKWDTKCRREETFSFNPLSSALSIAHPLWSTPQ